MTEDIRKATVFAYNFNTAEQANTADVEFKSWIDEPDNSTSAQLHSWYPLPEYPDEPWMLTVTVVEDNPGEAKNLPLWSKYGGIERELTSDEEGWLLAKGLLATLGI